MGATRMIRMQRPALTQIVLRLVALPILTAAASAGSTCAMDASSYGMYGLLEGAKLFSCAGANGRPAYGAELAELCLQACVADAECKSFDYLMQPGMAALSAGRACTTDSSSPTVSR